MPPLAADPQTSQLSLPAWPPAVLPYRDGMPIPQGYRLESRINAGLVYGGLAILLAPYATGLVVAAASGFSKRSGWLAVPVAGPFVAMSGRKIDCTVADLTYTGTGQDTSLNEKEERCRESVMHEAQVVAVLTLDGLLQTTGAIMTMAGLFSPIESLLRNDVYPLEGKLHLGASYQLGQVRLGATLQF
ncbi:MAG TPA: hypothetical protein VKP30_04460 [Polyangiaceae bacterium]|nr:hypothetical protein [Polyangiaceae bacterium]